MDTVTEADMAISMALQGGIGIIHKNLDPLTQRANIKRVKFYLNGFLAKARTMSPEQTIEDLLQIKAEKGWSFNSFPILGERRKLLGIITTRELKYCEDTQRRLGDLIDDGTGHGPAGDDHRAGLRPDARPEDFDPAHPERCGRGSRACIASATSRKSSRPAIRFTIAMPSIRSAAARPSVPTPTNGSRSCWRAASMSWSWIRPMATPRA